MADLNPLFLLGLLVSVTLFNCPTNSNAQGPPKILFAFGDSSYDVGNKVFLASGFVASTTWPYGKSVDLPSGRWSDGRVVPDLIAEFLEIPKPVPPVLDPKADLSNGVNFAVADATILGSPAETMTLAKQVKTFLGMKGNWSEKQISGGVYMFHIGADDYLNFAKSSPNATQMARKAVVSEAIVGLEKSLKELYNMGARKFAFQNLEPLGCLPIVRQTSGNGGKCLQALNDMAANHNVQLKDTLIRLAKNLPAFQYNVFDFYNATMRRINNPPTYRYATTTQSCCGIGTHNAFGCGFRNVHSNLCSYQRSYMYYDGRHNAEKTNEAMGHLFFSANKEVVGPMNLRELWVYPVDLSMLEE